MLYTKTIETILASLVLGFIAFLFTSPKKIIKRKNAGIVKTKEVDSSQDQNLFI